MKYFIVLYKKHKIFFWISAVIILFFVLLLLGLKYNLIVKKSECYMRVRGPGYCTNGTWDLWLE